MGRRCCSYVIALITNHDKSWYWWETDMTPVLWMICAAINVAIAALHIVIILVGERAYRYFGAGEWMAGKAADGSPIPALVTSAVTVVFFVFAAFNLSGAGVISLPLTMLALTGITAIYLLRGGVLVAVPFISTPVSTFDFVSSFAALVIGVLHAVALWQTYFAPSQV